MFREMRRKRQQLSEKEAAAVLERGTSGVLAVLGDGGYPDAVPLSYVYQDGKIYFHCAGSGHKLDGIRNCDKVSFCVIDQDEVHPEKYTTYFRSVIAFGKARILEEDEKRKAILLLTEKYCPKQREDWGKAIEREWKPLCMVEIQVEHMTGKQAIEMVK